MVARVHRALVLGSVIAAMSCAMSCHRIGYDVEPWRESCMDLCDAIFECFDRHPLDLPEYPAPVDAEECRERCADGWPNRGGSCVVENIAYADCLTDLSCTDMVAFYDDPFVGEPDRLCFEEFWTYSVCEEE